MMDWKRFVGKKFNGKRSGIYEVVAYAAYSGRNEQWNGKNALYIRSLSSQGNLKFPLMIDVLLLMKKDDFEPSKSMDEGFNIFCQNKKVPKLPSQNTAESYYVSFYKNFLIDSYYIEDETNDTEQSLESREEGNQKIKYSTIYERDATLRREAIKIHGVTCEACKFNFYEYYGDYGKNFIHIHHKIPISEYGGSIKINPKTDMIPLCPNCHAIVHRVKSKTLTIEELKEIINVQR